MPAINFLAGNANAAFADSGQPKDRNPMGSVMQRDLEASTFSIYRADEISITSALLSGGDWHWRLTSASGVILADCGGYRREADCHAVVAALRSSAHTASLPFHH